MTSFYTDEINTLILISLLKEHGIKITGETTLDITE